MALKEKIAKEQRRVKILKITQRHKVARRDQNSEIGSAKTEKRNRIGR